MKFTDKMKSIFNENLNKFNNLYALEARNMKTTDVRQSASDKIVFVLPLSGRYETFLRFLNNFEDVSLFLLTNFFKSNFILFSR